MSEKIEHKEYLLMIAGFALCSLLIVVGVRMTLGEKKVATSDHPPLPATYPAAPTPEQQAAITQMQRLHVIGTVLSKGTGVLTVKVTNASATSTINETFTVDSGTMIVMQAGKSREQFATELKAYQDSAAAKSGAYVPPPLPFTQSTSTFASIQPGANVQLNVDPTSVNAPSPKLLSITIAKGSDTPAQ